MIAVNEMPVARKKMTIDELLLDDGVPNGFSLWRMILALKFFQPGITVVVTHMRDSSYFVNVRLVYGVPMCPVNIVPIEASTTVRYDTVLNEEKTKASTSRYASFCPSCLDYRSSACLSVGFPVNDVRIAWSSSSRSSRRESVLPRCQRHVWFSRHELTLYYQTYNDRGATEPRPLMHEISCHGFLSVACFPFSTDISKLIVSINAHRRSLDIATTIYDNDWSKRYNDGNGKFTRLTFNRSDDGVDRRRRLVPRNAIRLLFAFGDMDMLNCEDGYVLNENIPLYAETTYRKKIAISSRDCSAVLSPDMTLQFDEHNGVRLHVGTLYTTSIVNVPYGNDVLIYHRDRTLRLNDGSIAHACDVYMTWNSSFVQMSGSNCGRYEPKTREAYVPNGDDDDGNGNQCLFNERCVYDDECAIRYAVVELFNRFLRISMCSKPNRQTLKLQNSFGQKGIAHYADLSDLITDRGEPIDVISSMYSLVGRSACGQLLEQRDEDAEVAAVESGRHDVTRTIRSRKTGAVVGAGGYAYFFVSSDFAHNHFIYHTKHGGSNPMRMCRLTYESLLENNASSTAFVKGCDFESSNSNPYAGIPRTVTNALNCYSVYQRSMHMTSQRVMRRRKREYDNAILRRIDAATTTMPSNDDARPPKRDRRY